MKIILYSASFSTKFKRKLNTKLLLLFVQTICLIILLRSGFELTSDYLEYRFEYKLIVSDNNNGYDLPSISVCTETQVMFDTKKAIDLGMAFEKLSRKFLEKYF